MIWGLKSVLGILKKNSEEKINGGVYGSWYGNTILVIFIGIVLHDILLFILGKSLLGIWFYIIYLVVVIILFGYLVTRRCCFGVTDNRFIYIKLGHFWFKEKDVDEILISSIKYLDVKKIGGLVVVKMSFINSNGRFKKIAFVFSSFVLGFDNKDYKTNYQMVLSRLREKQKILDKGDF